MTGITAGLDEPGVAGGAALVTALFVTGSRRVAPVLAPPPRVHGCALPTLEEA